MRKLHSLLLVCLLTGFSNGALAGKVLLETGDVARLLKGGDSKVVLVDMSGGLQYFRYHIPGAVRLDYGELVQRRRDKVAVRVTDQRLVALLGSRGIARDSHVIIYDHTGGLNAGRLFWELERIGHRRISVINGGLVKWVLEKRPLSNKPVKVVPVRYIIGPGKGRSNEAGLADISRRSQGTWLLDVRSEAEYTGHPRILRSGHIPGARWLAWNRSLNLPDGFRLLLAERLLINLVRAGVPLRRDTPVILYCRSGHRAAQTYLVLRHLGYSRVRLYDGSMAEYSRYPQLPLRKGPQP